MNHLFIKIISGTIITFLLSACAETTDNVAGIGGSGRVASGSITGFGSVFVNGVEFETDRTIFDVDGAPDGTQADLAIGMIVNVNGIINDDGITGIADKISFNEELQGPVTNLLPLDPNTENLTRTFSVLGVNVVVSNSNTTFDVSDGITSTFDFNNITNGNNVEISGFFDSSNNLIATRVELKNITFDADSIVEIKGTVSSLMGTTFNLGSVIVDASSATLDDLPNGLESGVFVEVKGTYNSTTETLTATKVEAAEDDDFDDSSEFEIEGLVTNYISDSNFKISGITVNASSATKEPTTLSLSNDIRVEAEGAIINGILIADKIKAREGSVKIQAPVSSVDVSANSFDVKPFTSQPAITIIVTTSTKLEDDVNDKEPFKLSDLVANSDFVEIEGFIGSNGKVIATEVEVKDPDDIEIQAIIESGSASSSTIKLLGIEFTIQSPGETLFEDANDSNVDQATFFDSIVLNTTLVKVKDIKPKNGIADEIEIETP